MKTMITPDEARARILAGLSPITETQQVPITETAHIVGRVLAAPHHARTAHPPADMSAMDGYAVRAADTARDARLRIIGESRASVPCTKRVTANTCVRIFTGAVMPDGADSVVIQEDVTPDENAHAITLASPIHASSFVRPVGLDFMDGDILADSGAVLTPRLLGLLASGNHATVEVVRQPRIAFFSSGDELVLPGNALAQGQIINSNSTFLAHAISLFGGIPVDLGIIPDTQDAVGRLLDGPHDYDLLLSTGGASVGDYDLIGHVARQKGLVIDFYKVSMRPGKPVLFGHFDTLPFLALPGNPVSVVVTALLFLAPAIRHLMQIRNAADYPPRRVSFLQQAMGVGIGRWDFQRGSLSYHADGTAWVNPERAQDSSMQRITATAPCLIIRPPHDTPRKQGDAIDCIPLDSIGL